MQKRKDRNMPEVKDDNKIKEMIDDLVKRARIAADEYTKLDQDQVDRIVKAMSMAGEEYHMQLAKMAVEETQR